MCFFRYYVQKYCNRYLWSSIQLFLYHLNVSSTYVRNYVLLVYVQFKIFCSTIIPQIAELKYAIFLSLVQNLNPIVCTYSDLLKNTLTFFMGLRVNCLPAIALYNGAKQILKVHSYKSILYPPLLRTKFWFMTFASCDVSIYLT